MSRKCTDLPKSKLSTRDAHLFKLSTKAVRKEEYRRRSVKRGKAYKKRCMYTPESQQICWHPRYTKLKTRDKIGTRRYPASWAPPITNKKPKGNISFGQTKKTNKNKRKKKTSRIRDQ
mmetsp:Transcript_4958/g.9214  ORF Transcript_4958/g.9214 Transcript_4958/m.9214 type:complete len:118 (+) Transcript_4958:181-534(+)